MNSKLPSTPQGAGVKRAWTMKDTSVAGHIWELVMLIAPGGDDTDGRADPDA